MNQLTSTTTVKTDTPKDPYTVAVNNWRTKAEELQKRRWRLINADLKRGY